MPDVHLPPIDEPLDDDGGRALVEAWRASGLSGAAFCRAHDVRPQRLYYWRERLGYPMRVMRTPSPSATLTVPPRSSGFVQVMVAPTTLPATTDVEIVVGGAMVRVRAGFDGAVLRAVVAALRAEPPTC